MTPTPFRAQRPHRGFFQIGKGNPRRSRWALSMLVTAAGCQTTQPPATHRPPATTQSAGPQLFDAPSLGIAFSYPAGWTQHPDPDATAEQAMRIVSPSGTTWLTLTVPRLPFHIPGMIPVNLVASGYADDVRKRMPDAAGPGTKTVTIPDAQARRVTLTGHESNGTATVEDAVLIVHGDHVYVLAADSEPAGRPAAAAALDAAIASLRWTR